MNLEKQENWNLIKDCCIVEEIAAINKRNECSKKFMKKESDEASNRAHHFENLHKYLVTQENWNLENSFEKTFQDDEIIQDFLSNMSQKKKHTIQSNYYRKAVEVAKEIKKDSNIDSELKKKFFASKQNLKDKAKTSDKKWKSAIKAAAVAVGLGILTSQAIPHSPNPAPTPIEMPTPDPAPTPQPTAISPAKDEDEAKAMFKNFYAKEYNKVNADNISADDLTFHIKSDDYVYYVRNEDCNQYVTHGSRPYEIQQYFVDHDIEVMDTEMDAEYITIENNGKQLDAAIDSNKTEKWEPIYDGEHPETLEQKPPSILASNQNLAELAYTFQYDTSNEINKEAFLREFNKKAKTYANANEILYTNSSTIAKRADDQLALDDDREDELER